MKEFSFFDTAPDFKDSWYEEYEQRMEKYKKVENDPYFNKGEVIWTYWIFSLYTCRVPNKKLNQLRREALLINFRIEK